MQFVRPQTRPCQSGDTQRLVVFPDSSSKPPVPGPTPDCVAMPGQMVESHLFVIFNGTLSCPSFGGPFWAILVIGLSLIKSFCQPRWKVGRRNASVTWAKLRATRDDRSSWPTTGPSLEVCRLELEHNRMSPSRRTSAHPCRRRCVVDGCDPQRSRSAADGGPRRHRSTSGCMKSRRLFMSLVKHGDRSCETEAH